MDRTEGSFVTSSRFRGDLRRRVPYSGSTMIRLRRATMSHGLRKIFLIGWVAFLVASSGGTASAQTDRADRHRVPAEFMSYRGADWLERAERVEEEEPGRVLDMMNLSPGDVVADVGCGSGYYARRMAHRVAPGGTVFCEDIQPEMLQIMRDRVREEGLTNVEAILGTPTDPQLPTGEIDWVIIADVYHEMSEPEPMLAGIRRALAPTGRVALLEYRVEDGSGDQIKADHVMSARQVVFEWQAAGFELEALHEFLPSQHLFFFQVAGGDRQDPVLADYDLFDALNARLIEVEARGSDDESVSLRIRRTGTEPILITSPVGMYFQASNGKRDMIARRDGWVILDEGGWQEWSIRTVGRQRDRDLPTSNDELMVRPPSIAPAVEAVLYQFQVGTYTVGNSPTLYPPRTHVVEQAAVWIADADESYRDMESEIAGPRVPPQYATAFALVFVEQAGIDVTTRRVWDDRQTIFRGLRDQGLNIWYQLQTQ